MIAVSEMYLTNSDVPESALVNQPIIAGRFPDSPENRVFVYFLRRRGAIKIGATVNPLGRLSAHQTSSPVALTFMGAVRGGYKLERQILEDLRPYRLHGEWVKTDRKVLQYIARRLKKGALSSDELIAVHRAPRRTPISRAEDESNVAALSVQRALNIAKSLSPSRSPQHRRRRCRDCHANWADWPSAICPGCAAYKDYTR